MALARRTFVGKAMSLLFNILSMLVITFLPRSKHLLISWLQSPSAVILEPRKIKSDTVSTVSPSISHEVMGPDAMILVFWMLRFKPTFSNNSTCRYFSKENKDPSLKSYVYPMFILALFTITKIWKQPKGQLIDEWIMKMWCIYTMGYYSGTKNKILPFATMWMDLEGIMLSQINQT